MAPSKNNSAQPPRYRWVADDLMQRIGSGTYPVGGILPTEMELSRHYGISRHTLREAFRRLRDAGLISSRRRVGTEVLARTPPANYRQPTNSIADFLQYAEETKLSVLQATRVNSGASLAALLECRPGDAWLRVTSLRTIPGDLRPICMATAYVHARFPDLEEHVAKLTGAISAMLVRDYGVQIARIEQSIEAVRLSKRQATLLSAEEGSPGLRATRRYYDDRGTLIELSKAVHPGDRFSYVTSLVRE